MLLGEIVETSRRVAASRGRRVKIAELAACLQRAAPSEREIAAALLSGALPRGRVGIGPAQLRAARPGAPAPSSSLTVRELQGSLEEIGRIEGAGSVRERTERLRTLLACATRDEQRFLTRLLLGEVRQGALAGLLIEAIALAAKVPAAAVRRAWMLEGDLPRVARAALEEGNAGLERFSVRLGRPLQPMLASPADDPADALAALGRAAFEYKLDGARIQVHKDGDRIRVFTRRLHDVTPAVPEIVEAVRALPAGSLILDGEALAFRSDGRPHPFQVTMRRFGRRLDVEAMRRSLPLRPFFFDCLHCDGRDWIDADGAARFGILSRVAPEGLVVPRRVTEDVEAAHAFLEQALRSGHEGLVAKSLAAPYAAGLRGQEWLKLKPAHTLDLVVLAAEWGHGRRRGWLSNLHLGALDASDPGALRFVMLGKTFKGMTDAVLEWQTRRLQELETGRDGHTVYVQPELVVEVAFDGVQQSPHYPAGLALRFARLKRYRPDKSVAEADRLETVRAIHEGRRGNPTTRVPGA